MGWAQSGRGKGGDALPQLTIEKNKSTRIRCLGPNCAGELKESKFEEVQQRYVHWTPKSLNHKAPVPCIKVRNGCIFHEEPLLWRCAKNNWINVIWYEGYDAQKKSYTNRKIVAAAIPTTVCDQIVDTAASMGIEIDMVDWVISKRGEGMNDTTYNAIMVSKTIDGDTIDLSEFPAQEAFASIDFPMLVDYDAFDSNKKISKNEQIAWYEKLNEQEENGDQPEEEQEKPMGRPAKVPPVPSGVAGKNAGKPATATGAKISMPGARGPIEDDDAPPPLKKKASGLSYADACEVLDPHGTPLGETKYLKFYAKGVNVEHEVTAEIVAAAKIVLAGPPEEEEDDAPPPPPKKKAGKSAALIAYEKAIDLVDPWGDTLGDSKQIKFIAKGANAQYEITAELAAAAKIVLAGPPEEADEVADPPVTKKKTPPPPPEEAEEGNDDITALRTTLTQFTKKLPVFKDYKNLRRFLENCGGGAKSINAIEDGETLQALIDLCEEGDDAVENAIA